eukprot:14453031-Alexandrium_andersonii.AAC.1
MSTREMRTTDQRACTKASSGNTAQEQANSGGLLQIMRKLVFYNSLQFWLRVAWPKQYSHISGLLEQA